MKLLLLFVVISLGCEPPAIDVKEYLAGWEYLTTYHIVPDKSVVVSDKRARLTNGENNVLVVTAEQIPIYKQNAPKLQDVHGYKRLVIELDADDTLVTPADLGNSKIYREILQLSPKYGVNNLELNEKIEIKKEASDRWNVSAQLYDFDFEGDFTFSDSMTIVNRHKQLY